MQGGYIAYIRVCESLVAEVNAATCEFTKRRLNIDTPGSEGKDGPNLSHKICLTQDFSCYKKARSRPL